MSQTQDVENRMREMILELELGPGEKLTERWAEGYFGASRTPIRAALLRLESEGLVLREGRGWVVAPINVAEIEQLLVYREVLEVAAMRQTMSELDLDAVADLEALLDACGPDSSVEERVRVGMEFHIHLAALSGNAFFRDGVADAMVRVARARWLGRAPEYDGWVEHRAILQAMREGQADEAVRLVGEHVDKHRKSMLALLQQDRRTLRARGLSVV